MSDLTFMPGCRFVYAGVRYEVVKRYEPTSTLLGAISVKRYDGKPTNLPLLYIDNDLLSNAHPLTERQEIEWKARDDYDGASAVNYITATVKYCGRTIRYQSAEKVWVFNIRRAGDGRLERRVRNTLRGAKEEIDRNY